MGGRAGVSGPDKSYCPFASLVQRPTGRRGSQGDDGRRVGRERRESKIKPN